MCASIFRLSKTIKLIWLNGLFAYTQVFHLVLFLFASECPLDVPGWSQIKGTTKSFITKGSSHHVPLFLFLLIKDYIYISVLRI